MAISLALVSRVVYASSYTFLHLVLLALLMVSPGDIINQSRLRHNVYPILIVSICYLSTLFIGGFIYLVRLYISRSVLNSIPKAWIPIEKGEVSASVRALITAGLGRSAAVAFAAQPRVLLPPSPSSRRSRGSRESGGDNGGDFVGCRDEDGSIGRELVAAAAAAATNDDDDDDDNDDDAVADATTATSRGHLGKFVRLGKVATVEQKMGIDLPPFLAVWGDIEHPGWAPPGTGDELADLQYSTVVAELPSLIEAKALTLAPEIAVSAADADADANTNGQPSKQAKSVEQFILDPEAVALLQRPPFMGLRAYLAHLAELDVIDISGDGDGNGNGGKEDGHGNGDDGRPLSAVVTSFVSMYEYARFSTQMLTQAQFRQLMRDLATLLRRMKPLDPDRLLYDDDDDDDDDDDGGIYGGGGDHDAGYVGDDDDDAAIYGDDEYDGESFTESARSGMYSASIDDASNGDIDSNAAGSTPTSVRSLSRRPSVTGRQAAVGRRHQSPPQGQHHSHGHQASKLARSSSARTAGSGASGYSRASSAVSAVSAVSKFSGLSSTSSSSSTADGRNSNETSRHYKLRPAGPSAKATTSSSAQQHQQHQQRLRQRPGDVSLTLPKSRRKPAAAAASLIAASRSSSASSLVAQPPRRPYPVAKPSISSLRSATSSGSVIRLADHGDSSGLPYVLLPMSTRGGS